MPAYRLHYFPESGNSFKIALMLTLCGQTFEPIWTDFGGGMTRTAEWRSAVNEMGEIPVLEEDGDRLSQTAPLLLRLAERYGRFGGRDESEQFEILRWLFWDNYKLTGYMAPYRFQRAFTQSPDPNALKFLKDRLDQFLDILEKRLARQSFCDWRTAERCGSLRERVSPIPKRRERVRFRREPPRDRRVVAAGRCAAWMAGALRIAAREAADQLRACAVGMMTAASANVAVPEGVRPLFWTSSKLLPRPARSSRCGVGFRTRCWRRPRPVPLAETVNSMGAAGVFKLEAI